MLDKIDKIAPYAAVALLGYLCHTTMVSASPRAAQGKDGALISKEMLKPELVVTEPHASPVNRDPFEVRWASYREGDLFAPGGDTGEASPGGDAAAYAVDDGDGPPPLPHGLTAVLRGDSGQYVVVGDRLCTPGDPVAGNDPRRSWVVERVDADGVVLRFGNIRRKVALTPAEAPRPEATSAPAEDAAP